MMNRWICFLKAFYLHTLILQLQLYKYFQAQPLFRYWFKFLKVRTEDNCCSCIHYSTISYLTWHCSVVRNFGAFVLLWHLKNNQMNFTLKFNVFSGLVRVTGWRYLPLMLVTFSLEFSGPWGTIGSNWTQTSRVSYWQSWSLKVRFSWTWIRLDL